MLPWPLVVCLLAPPGGEGATAPAPPSLPPPTSASAPAGASQPSSGASGGVTDARGTAPRNTHEEIAPAKAEARPGEHTREWRPPAELARVPFPLERTRPNASDRRFRAPIVDLRDPFVHGRPSRPLSAEMRRKLLPDLKDPFAAPRHPRPRGWKVALPGDIRDPFEERDTNYRNPCDNQPQSTRDGVTIQRPKSIPDAQSQTSCQRLIRPLPADLLDPFRRR